MLYPMGACTMLQKATKLEEAVPWTSGRRCPDRVHGMGVQSGCASGAGDWHVHRCGDIWGKVDTSQKPATASGSPAGSSTGGCGQRWDFSGFPAVCARTRSAEFPHTQLPANALSHAGELETDIREQERRSLVHGDSTLVSSGSGAAAAPGTGVGEFASTAPHLRAPAP